MLLAVSYKTDEFFYKFPDLNNNITRVMITR